MWDQIRLTESSTRDKCVHPWRSAFWWWQHCNRYQLVAMLLRMCQFTTQLLVVFFNILFSLDKLAMGVWFYWSCWGWTHVLATGVWRQVLAVTNQFYGHWRLGLSTLDCWQQIHLSSLKILVGKFPFVSYSYYNIIKNIIYLFQAHIYNWKNNKKKPYNFIDL